VDRRKDPDHASCASLVAGLHVDLGFSFYYRKPVVDLLAAKIPRSVELALAALAVQLLLGVGLGVLAGAKKRTAWDEATIGAALVGVSAPTFLLGLVLQYLFAYKLRALPYDGYGVTPAEHVRRSCRR
jgi:peptide/nickel transport system permease protein